MIESTIFKYVFFCFYTIFQHSERIAETITRSFQEQLDAVENMFPQQLHLSFTHKTVEQILDREPYCSAHEKERVRDIIFMQMRNYPYMFL